VTATSVFYFISNCGSEVRLSSYKMSSGPPNKEIKKFLTDTKQLKVRNFFSSKSLDTVMAANPKRPTTIRSNRVAIVSEATDGRI
jgi:hypothetical protein